MGRGDYAEDIVRAHRCVVESTRDGFWLIDQNAVTRVVNPRFAELLGCSVADLVGRPMGDLLDASSVSVVRAVMQNERAGEDRSVSVVLRHADGTGLPVMLALDIAKDADGAHVGWLASVIDMTPQLRLQEQLMVADRMASVGTLAAGVAHEVNNPLAAILANLNLVLRAARDPQAPQLTVGGTPLNEVVTESIAAAERVRDIVRDLMVFSRIEQDRRVLVDVEKVMESAIRIAGNDLRHRATLVRRFQALPLVEANESRLGQVFLNLILNASQAMEEGHADRNTITVSTRTDPQGRAIVEVQDTGTGMSPEVMRRLFTPFFTTKPIGAGTGLGLSICHRIVTAIGGSIEVESTPGKGTTFRVVLVGSPKSEQEKPDSIQPSEAPARRGRVLVIDDDAIVVKVMRRALSDEHDVTPILNPREALSRIVGGERFDVILCDLMMPHVSGIDVHRELSERAPDQAARMIFLTGGAFTDRARNFLASISNQRLEKPFDMKVLRAMIRAFL